MENTIFWLVIILLFACILEFALILELSVRNAELKKEKEILKKRIPKRKKSSRNIYSRFLKLFK